MKGKKIRVLVIDDETMITKVLKGFLDDHGFSVRTASNGADGLRLISSERFDAAIVDIRLPDMEGDEVIVKASVLQPGVKFFIHTGSIDYAPSADLLTLGVGPESIIHKPVIDMGEICGMIERKVGGNRA